MSESSARPLAPVEIGTQHACVKIELFDGALNRAASGYGRLQAELPAGLYQLQLRAGPAVQQRLISVRPGQGYREMGVEVPFASPAPLPQTTTTRESHQGPVEQAVRTPAGGARARFVFVLRNLLPRGAPERGGNEPVIDPAGGGWRLELVDAAGQVSAVLNERFILDAGGTVATAVVPVDPGGYLLRVRRVGGTEFDQSLWVSEPWQTLVFIPHTPGGPAAELASVHGAALGAPWLGEQESEDVGLAVEMALGNLRQGRTSLPEAGLRRLLNAKFANPMLGVLGAHLLLLRPDVDWDLFQVVLGNLERRLFGRDQPDVQVLRGLGAMQGGGRIAPPAEPVRWPPLLHRSYTSLLALDAEGLLRIEPGSPAERVAPFIVEQGSWTSWRSQALRPEPRMPAPDAALPPRADLLAEGPGAADDGLDKYMLSDPEVEALEGPDDFEGFHGVDVFGIGGTTAESPRFSSGRKKKRARPAGRPERKRAKEPWMTTLAHAPVQGAAAERVRAYLLQVARNEEPGSATALFGAADPKWVSRNTSLPVSTVTEAMSQLRRALDV